MQNFATSGVLIEVEQCAEGWVGFCWLAVYVEV